MNELISSTSTSATPSSSSALVTLSHSLRCRILNLLGESRNSSQFFYPSVSVSRTNGRRTREIIIADRLNNEAIFLHICGNSMRAAWRSTKGDALETHQNLNHRSTRPNIKKQQRHQQRKISRNRKTDDEIEMNKKKCINAWDDWARVDDFFCVSI